MDKRWKILTADPLIVESLHQSLKINKALVNILVQRGINTFEESRNYFRPKISDLHDPWLMKDMKKAVTRIHQAREQEEKILIFGDYDVDGTTAVACMYRFISEFHSNIDFYIPHRYREGYGISKAGIDFAHENNFSLIISLDCGIKSVELIGYAASLGIDFIVCDHHLPDEILPPAIAILNPKQKDCNYPYKELCGCGVGFKLITALAQAFNIPIEKTYEYLDLVATAIAADIVHMTGENRVLAFFGLLKANENPNNGIKALCFLSGVKEQLHINNLVFMIAPRVNAAGRMDDARKAVQMFISETYEEALSFAEMLHSDNTERKEADSTITDEALALILENKDHASRKSTVVFKSHWHKGVVGIVASRLIEHHYKPTIVLTQSGDVVAGSARSVSGFNVYEAIHQCKDLLVGYGGHFYAAGMTMKPSDVEAFQLKFEEVVSGSITEDLLIPEIIIDTEIKLSDINQTFFNIINQMEPFGPGNLRPVFITKNVFDTGFSKIVKEKHVRFVLKQNNITFTGIGFCLAEKFHLIKKDQPLDILFTLDENEWNGQKSIQLKMIDFRHSEN